MHEYKATIDWKNVNGADFLKGALYAGAYVGV
ncbi:hypothetical protein CfE428DRAFT_3575 [Chthoniobacter flavus Ellin428]|uniref:Uncharacterized protein n=1 Tax=Chthoniobacter flavus Ellin428 TaxID=497964 RepID=B4D3T7_9BACT|nr:hypothetical protein CfE428DRAFT_3575 [Chthoniobacter flavus Ellin428]